MNIKKFFFFFLSLLFFTSFYVTQNKTLANTILLQDDFEDENVDGWGEYDGMGGWEVKEIESSNFVYEGNVTLSGYPEDPAYSINGNVEWTNYTFEVDIKGIEGVDKVVGFRFRSANERYLLNIVSQWSGGGNIVNIHKESPLHTNHIFQKFFVNYPNRWYRLKIAITNINESTTNIKVYIKDLDNNIDYGLIVDFDDNNHPITSGKICLHMWPGGPIGVGSVTRTQFDNILVTTTSTPSPNPIILLPGLGASWNHEAMILGQHKEPEDWYMTPFVKAYDGLIQTLKNSGYEDRGDDKNLFIFNYDWRQPIETIAIQLENYIENTVNPPTETKIDLIGHSLGGMVARDYIQNDPDHQIDQLITLGSPHKGAPQVYYLWEGADLNRAFSTPWQRIGTGILLQLNKCSFENNVETIHQVLPGLKNLLPTFPYLKKNRIEKPLLDMNERNEWLENLNFPPLPEFLTSVLNNFVGLKGNTLRWISITNRNLFDKFLGRWLDGKPIGKEYEMGDESVLAESAQLSGTTVTELSGVNHSDLVESFDGQQAIVNLLGISPSEIIPTPEIVYEPSLVFLIASPANLTVLDPNGALVTDGEKLVFIPNPEEGDYQIQVNQEDGGGSFRLLIGKILTENDIWQEFGGQTTDEPQIFTTTFSKNPSENKLELLNLAKQKLELMKEEVLKSRKPFKFFLISVIKWKINQVNKAIRFLKKGKEKLAQNQIEKTIFSFIFFEKNLKFWSVFYPPEFQQELLEDIRISRDYLLQAYEIDSSL